MCGRRRAPSPANRRPLRRDPEIVRRSVKILGIDTAMWTRRGFIGMTAGAAIARAQEKLPTFKVKVDMVVLSFQVQDSKNHYINGLKHTDFRIYEDGILQRVATFAEGAKAPLAIAEDGSTHPLLEGRKDLPGMERPDAFVGTNVFV